jgi:hypothetical protein
VDKTVRGGDMVKALSPFNVFAHMAGEDGGRTIPGAQFVPAFYAGELTDEEKKYTGVAGLLIAIAFGAVHCIAWSYQFPSHLEQMLWRTSTVAIVCTPAAVFSVSMFLPPPPPLMALLLICCAVYVISRVVLLVLAFMSLRSLPSGAYQAVNWTAYLPHM